MQTEEICTSAERSLSKMKPRLRVESVGVCRVPWKVRVAAVSFERYCGVLMIKNSVLEGLTERRFEVSQA